MRSPLAHRLLSILSPLTGTGGVGFCPACVAVSASVLSWLGLSALIPVWRPIAFTLLGLGLLGFALDWRVHRNPLPLSLLTVGGVLLYLGRYVYGGPEFGGWSIWGPGAVLAVAGVLTNRWLFRRLAHRTHGPAVAPLSACPVCKLRYRERQWAERCEAWCRVHQSCNLEITKHALKPNI